MEHRARFSLNRLVAWLFQTHSQRQWKAFQTDHLEGSVKWSTFLLLHAVKCYDYTCEWAFSLNVWRVRANLGGKSDPSGQPILLIKCRAVFFFYMHQKYWSCRSFKLKMPSYPLMSSTGYLTGGCACFCCNIWQPSSSDSFNVNVFLLFFFSQLRVSLRNTFSHCALPNKKFHYKPALSAVWKCLFCS